MKKKTEEVRVALNKLNLGTNKIKLGDFIADLIIKVDTLENRVAEIESTLES